MSSRALCLSLATLALVASAPLARSAAAQTSAAPAAAWSTFRSAEGRFSVLFPAAPKREDKAIADGPAAPGSMSLYMATTDRSLYLVGFADYNPAFDFDIQAELEANRDNFVRGLGGTLVSTAPAKLGSAPGLEFTGEKAGQWTTRGRVFIHRRRPYQIAVVAPPGSARSAEVERFLASFRIDGTG